MTLRRSVHRTPQLARVLAAALTGAIAVFVVSSLAVVAESPPPAATAAPGPGPEFAQPLFAWAFKPGGLATNWPEGLLYAALGVVGALVTLYLFAGELLPSMGGKAALSLKQSELENQQKRQHEAQDALTECARKPGSCTEANIQLWTSLVDHSTSEAARIEQLIDRARRQLFLTGVPLYIVLGGFFATAAATTIVQALLIGFGWTAVAERIGFKREVDARKDEREKQLEVAEQELQAQKAYSERVRAAALRTLDENTRLQELLAARAGGSGQP